MHADIIICFMWLFARATPTDMAIESAATVSVFNIMSSSVVPWTAGMMLKDSIRRCCLSSARFGNSGADAQRTSLGGRCTIGEGRIPSVVHGEERYSLPLSLAATD